MFGKWDPKGNQNTGQLGDEWRICQLHVETIPEDWYMEGERPTEANPSRFTSTIVLMTITEEHKIISGQLLINTFIYLLSVPSLNRAVDLRTFSRKSSNIDNFIKLLLLIDELLVSEMQK